jgi:fatty-acyl-CoA synthase
VAPAEIEAVYGMHDGIEQIYVTGIPSDHLDEALAAVIVLSGAPVGQKELITFGRDTLAGYKVPRHYRFVASDELPLTSTGKLQRNRLAEFFD